MLTGRRTGYRASVWRRPGIPRSSCPQRRNTVVLTRRTEIMSLDKTFGTYGFFGEFIHNRASATECPLCVCSVLSRTPSGIFRGDLNSNHITRSKRGLESIRFVIHIIAQCEKIREYPLFVKNA